MKFCFTSLMLMWAFCRIIEGSGEVCIELNERTSNGRLTSDYADAVAAVLLSPGEPNPEFDLPSIDPYEDPLGARYILPSGAVLDLKNIRIEGIRNVQAENLEFVGKGRSRVLLQDFASPVETVSADYSVQGKGRTIRGSLTAVAYGRRYVGSLTIEPARVNVMSMVTTTRMVQLESKPEINLRREEEKELVERVINDAIRLLNRRMLEAVVRSKCN